MKVLFTIALLITLSACASTAGGPRTDWRCDGGAAYSVRPHGSGVEVFAGGRTYSLDASGGDYSDGVVRYSANGELTGAFGGPYNNCRRR